MQNNEDNEQLISQFREQIAKNWGSFCSACGTQKGIDSLKVLRKMGPAIQFVSECNNCGLETVITLVPNLGMQVTQLRTDISANEFERFTNPLTTNDYLEFYSAIKNITNVNDLIKVLHK